MAKKSWYEIWPERLVLEYLSVKAGHTNFQLCCVETRLYWEGEVSAIPPGILADPLNIMIRYPQAFPASGPSVQIVSPEINTAEVGHNWHRYANGNVCFIKPSNWQISTTAEEIITKVEDWYFNYLAKKSRLIEKMPDFGRADIAPAKIGAA